jgi:predicted nucleic acid-binding protein
MSGINLFLDSSALLSGIINAKSACRAILLLAESDLLDITISEQVVAETERTIARRAPRGINDLRKAILASHAQIVRDPSPQDVSVSSDQISHVADVPIMLAAVQVQADYLVTINCRHFIDDPEITMKAGWKIASPGDALRWVQGQLSAGDDQNY